MHARDHKTNSDFPSAHAHSSLGEREIDRNGRQHSEAAP
jgi:hypothetical protein